MKVWIVIQYCGCLEPDCDFRSVEKVFSSREKAEKYATKNGGELEDVEGHDVE